MKLRSIQTVSGQTVELSKLNVLVGSNNVGKSQTLKDVHHALRYEGVKTVIVNQVHIAEDPLDELLTDLNISEDKSNNTTTHTIRDINSSLKDGENALNINLDDWRKRYIDNKPPILAELGKFSVIYLDGESRLSVARTAQGHSPHIPSRNLLQKLHYNDSNDSIFRILDRIFFATFRKHIYLDSSSSGTFSFRVLDKKIEIPENHLEQFNLLNDLPLLDEQGEGYKSFMGVVLSIILSKNKIILLDEPEAFLHPAQAKQLGKWIGNYVNQSSNQLIISTHNSHFLSGILSSAESPTIQRLNRKRNITMFNQVTQKNVLELTQSPLLSSQRVIEAFFHKGAIICEGDSDRSFYESVYSKLSDNNEVVFLHAQSKQSIHQVVSLFNATKIGVAAIVDIDILNSSSEFERLIKQFLPQKSWSAIFELRNKIAYYVDGMNENDILTELVEEMENLLLLIKSQNLSLTTVRSSLKRLFNKNKWKSIKKYGVSSLPQDHAVSAQNIIDECSKFGLFIVPKGTLESWLDLPVPKNVWIIEALTYVSNNPIPTDLAGFVRKCINFFRFDR